MKYKILRLYESFRIKVLMSFFSFAAIIFAWVFIYFLIHEKQVLLSDFKNKLTSVQNHFLENNRNLEYFVLVGYHQAGFYNTGRQKEMDSFLAGETNEIAYLQQLKGNSISKKTNLNNEIERLIQCNKQLLDSVLLLKTLYYKKGFQYYGTEGEVLKYAHQLEDATLVPRVELLQLRRREKDYLLRGDQKYIKEYNDLVDKLLVQFQNGTVTGDALEHYRQNFIALVGYTNRLGINTTDGIYYHVQEAINQEVAQYNTIRAKAEIEVRDIQNTFHNILITVSIFLSLVVVLLSWFRSDFLTRDIKRLNHKIAAFVASHFKDVPYENKEEARYTKITEIDNLNKNYIQLTKTLKKTLSDLENSVKEEKKASEYKSSFVANISHEIRTPLTGIIGTVHLLKGTKLNEEQNELIDTLDFSANHLRELINMVLDYSKIEAGKLELEQIPFDLKGDLTKLVKLFEYKIIEKGLQFTVDYQLDHPYYVIGDPLRLQQIFFNLLTNAIKFTHSGSIYLRVIPISITETIQHIRFEVEDSGIGIAIHEIDKLFEAFNQANTSISRNFGGTGLGLTISNQLVKLMGGELQVQSERNKGSVFTFQIKFNSGEPLKNKQTEPIKDNTVYQKLKLLLAEDNMVNQKVISKMLQKYEAEIDFAGNGFEAVKLFKTREYDIILMDIQMPEMDGFEATKIICKSEKYAHRHVPIIAFSANAYNEDRRKAMEAGMDDFLSKPIKAAELDGIIAKYGARKQLAAH